MPKDPELPLTGEPEGVEPFTQPLGEEQPTGLATEIAEIPPEEAQRDIGEAAVGSTEKPELGSPRGAEVYTGLTREAPSFSLKDRIMLRVLARFEGGKEAINKPRRIAEEQMSKLFETWSPGRVIELNVDKIPVAVHGFDGELNEFEKPRLEAQVGVLPDQDDGEQYDYVIFQTNEPAKIGDQGEDRSYVTDGLIVVRKRSDGSLQVVDGGYPRLGSPLGIGDLHQMPEAQLQSRIPIEKMHPAEKIKIYSMTALLSEFILNAQEQGKVETDQGINMLAKAA